MKTLGDVVEIIRDHAGAEGLDGRIGPADLVADQLRIRPSTPASSQAVTDPRALRVQANDILFSSVRPRLRRLAIASGPGSCSPEILVLRPKIDPVRAFAMLAHSATWASVRQRAHGTRMPRIRGSDLERIPTPPPLGPREVEAVGALLQRLRVLHRRDLAERDLLRLRGTQVMAEAQGPRIADIAELRALRRDGHAPGTSFQAADLPPGGLSIHTRGSAPLTASYVPVHADDLLFLGLRPSTHRVGVAPESGHASAEVLCLSVDPTWRVAVAAWLLQPSTARHFARLASGTRAPRLPRSALMKARIPGDPLRAARPLLERAGRSPHLARRLHDALHHVIHGTGERTPAGAVSSPGTVRRPR